MIVVSHTFWLAGITDWFADRGFGLRQGIDVFFGYMVLIYRGHVYFVQSMFLVVGVMICSAKYEMMAVRSNKTLKWTLCLFFSN